MGHPDPRGAKRLAFSTRLQLSGCQVMADPQPPTPTPHLAQLTSGLPASQPCQDLD